MDKTINKDSIKIIASNKKANFLFHINDTYEAGIELLGSEVKSILLVDKKEDIELLALAKNDLITAARCNVLDLEVGKELDAKILN